ncbi:hypothetical protein L345_17057, partial [Ophiophagus hannah]
MKLASFSLIVLALMSRTFFCQAEKPAQQTLLEALNGTKADLLCSHPNIKTNEYIYWYRQFSNQSLHLVASGFSGKLGDEKISLNIPKDNRKTSTLSFTKVTFEDQALYLCAVGDTVTQTSESLWQKPFLVNTAATIQRGKKGRCENSSLNV